MGVNKEDGVVDQNATAPNTTSAAPKRPFFMSVSPHEPELRLMGWRVELIKRQEGHDALSIAGLIEDHLVHATEHTRSMLSRYMRSRVHLRRLAVFLIDLEEAVSPDRALLSTVRVL